MHQGIYMDAKDYHQCGWMTWMSIHAQVVPWCSNTFLWMIKMTLDGAGCLGCLSMLINAGCLDAQVMSWCTKGFIWMLKLTIDAAGCLGCLLMHKLCLDAAKHFYGWSKWPSMELDVLDVYLCSSCALMNQHIFMDTEDDPKNSWMSWMSINAHDVLWCCWMFWMSINAHDDPRCCWMSGGTSYD